MEIIEEIKSLLGEQLSISGAAFYSNVSTLKPGKFMVLGMNPGGNPELIKTSIGDSFTSFLNEDYNEYYADWKGDGTEHRLQSNLKYIFSKLGSDLKDVLAMNLIFERTARESHLKLENLDTYRQILKKVVSYARPEVIITFGNRPFNELRSLISSQDCTSTPANHAKWTIDMLTGQLAGQPIKVVKFPHLSIYTIYNRPDVMEVVSNFVANTQ